MNESHASINESDFNIEVPEEYQNLRPNFKYCEEIESELPQSSKKSIMLLDDNENLQKLVSNAEHNPNILEGLSF